MAKVTRTDIIHLIASQAGLHHASTAEPEVNMRPGPGLVVMALAFISGARRGSTSSISSKTTTTSSPPPTLQILTTTTPASSLTLFQTTVTTSPTSSSSFSFISSTTTTTTTSTPPTTTGDTITTTSSPPTTQPIQIYENFGYFGSHIIKEQENDHQIHLSKRPKEPVPFNFFNTFFTRNSYNSNPSTSNYFAYTYPLPSHLTQHYDDPRARTESNTVLHSAKHTRRANAKFRRRRKRRTRSANVSYRGSGTGSDDATENLNDSDDTLTSLTTAVDSSSDSVLSDQTTLARGLPVHFPSLTAADSSRSLDEDDIFALVAEDDLLSEESFDHLVKLTNDKIGDTNEEDYSSGTETVVESSSGSGSGAPDNVLDAPDQQNAIEDFVREHRQQQQQQEHDQQHEDHKENPQHQDDNVGDNGNKQKPNRNHDSEQDDVDTIYTAHLVGNSNEKVVSLAETDSTHSSDPVRAIEKEDNLVRATTTTTTTTKHPKAELDSPNRYHTILGSHFALTRLNPWISACDLAQPGPLSAPDLQGECSAGTLPVAWVDEGPGPPTCLKSCKEETPFTNKLNKDNMNNLINNNNNNNNSNNNIKNNNNNSKQNKNKNDNKLNKLVGYTTTTNTFNIKLRNSQPTISHSMNTNNNNKNNKNMDNNKSNSNNMNNMKLLNPFNYYQINTYNSNSNNNNNKMAKIRRNSKETTSSDHSDVETNPSTTTNVTTTQKSEDNVAQSKDKLSVSLHSSEDYELLHDMLMQQDEAATNTKQNQQQIQYNDDDVDEDQRHQFNDAAIAAAAVVMQLNQQQQQNHNNNNIVKMKLTTSTTTNYNDNNSNNNNNNNQFDLKYNHFKQGHVSNGNANNKNNHNMNRRYQSNNNNINNSQQRSDISAANPTTTTTTTTNHAVAANNDNSDQYLNIPPPEKQQQQCLEYLGDSDTTMPTHLCHLLTPSDRLAQLRHLRLRNCCERNVYSALHTMALNATLSGGAGCLRVLQDLMDLDALASRITCGLTEILFRFDCRQVYSIIHQCDDCKEAYRRWVCSTLVPYFAETSDIMKPPEILTTTIESTSLGSASNNGVNSPNHSYKLHALSNSSSSNSSSNNTTMASNMTTSHTATTSANSSSKINNNETDLSSAMPTTKQATSNFITNSNNKKHDMQYNGNNYQQQHFYMQQQQQQHHVKRRNIQKQQHEHEQQQKHQHFINHILIDNSSSNNHNKINDIHYKTILIHHKNQPQQQLHPSTISQALIFNDIITLNPRTTSPRYPLRTRTTARLQSFNATNEAAFGLNFHHKSTNKRRKRSDNSTLTTTTIFADVVVNRPSMSSTPSLSSSYASSSSSSSSSVMHQVQRQKQQQQQSFNFISTANNEDSLYAKNPVITKLLKRSKRKEFEFRKRRRIRPCLSVCQTVEQKCPYLLPADRAPSMPTQYAGEPTFLCLDYNIAETKEQLEKASHGPNDCCYTYCSNSGDGICTYCNDMWDKTEIEKEVDILTEERETKVFNITMKTKDRGQSNANIRVETKIQQKMGEEKNGLKMSTVAIAVRNDTAFENATLLAERLQYYAFCDGVFYYDDDADDMPEYPNSENCRELPAVQSRCTIPYYATNYMSSADMLGSYRKHNEAQKLLIWLSTLLCLWSCYSARSMRMRRYNEDKKQQQSEQELTHQNQQQQQLHKTTNTAYKGENMCQSCQTREIMQNEGNCEKIIKLWYDDRECRIIIIYWLKITNVTKTTTTKQHKKSLRANYLLKRNFPQILRRTSVKLNLKILEIPSLILLINYKEFLLLLFKKRQKLRKRKNKSFPKTTTTMARRRIVKGKCWPLIRDLKRFRNMKSKPKKCSFKYKKSYYYDYYNYYYCSCRQIFSCSCNKNIINNYYNNNIKYMKKKFKYNFSTCNFKNTTNNNNNNNKNHKNNNNKMMIMKINYKKVSIIKFNTTTTTTHIFIINSYNINNNNISNSNNNKTNYYNIITIIIISYNIYNNRNSNNKQKQIFNSFYSISNNSHYHQKQQQQQQQHHHYYYNNNYPNNKNNNIMINNNTLTLSTTSLSSSSAAASLSQIFKTNMIFKISSTMFLIIMHMLIMLIMPLLFKSFMKMKYNNNHHMKNIIIINSNLSLSPNTSYNMLCFIVVLVL
ncbi:hypothetical protein CVS40_1616 [Lucilia cuprina]|nr:hypothetical protein CVS40_1616 [Lucilia cuprina]